ncbi:MAG: trigger factor [Puniceicoccales bacterium]|nr:trigger factor [Puniceicoccales bacterium]
MKKEIITVNNTRSSILFHFPQDEISAQRDVVTGEFCATVSLPGFRKGKVPKNIILSKFSSAIDSRTKAALADKAFEELQQSEEELNLLAIVDYSTENAEDGFVCKLTFDLRPNIELPDYKSVTLSSFSEEISADEVDAELEHIKKYNSKYNAVERESKAGDYVKVNYEGILEDGTAIADIAPNHKIYGRQVGTWEEAGNGDVQGVQAVIQGVIGRKVGDKCEAEETFPDDFPVAELAGKKATYAFEILEVRERVDPELNESFLRQCGVDSVDALRARIAEHLAGRKRTQGLVKQRDEVVHFLANSAKFELPESVIQKEVNGLAQAFVDSQVRNGVPAKSFEGRADEISQNLFPIAEIRAKAGLMLDKIAEVEKIEIGNGDIEAMILQDAALKRIGIDQYVREIKGDRSKLIDIRTRTRRGKALDFLVVTNSKEVAKTQESREDQNTAEI